jgi:hypothetical protein
MLRTAQRDAASGEHSYLDGARLIQAILEKTTAFLAAT